MSSTVERRERLQAIRLQIDAQAQELALRSASRQRHREERLASLQQQCEQDAGRGVREKRLADLKQRSLAMRDQVAAAQNMTTEARRLSVATRELVQLSDLADSVSTAAAHKTWSLAECRSEDAEAPVLGQRPLLPSEMTMTPALGPIIREPPEKNSQARQTWTRSGHVVLATLAFATEGHRRGLSLFCIKGKQVPRFVLVAPAATSLHTSDVFVLQSPKRLYVWNGQKATFRKKSLGQSLAQLLRSRRKGGMGEVATLDQAVGRSQQHMLSAHERRFWQELGGMTYDVPLVVEGQYDDLAFEELCDQNTVLTELQGHDTENEVARGLAISRLQLKSDRVYLLRAHMELYAWIGHRANPDDQTRVQLRLRQLEAEQAKTSWCKAAVVIERSEPVAFQLKFPGWLSLNSPASSASKPSYGIARSTPARPSTSVLAAKVPTPTPSIPLSTDKTTNPTPSTPVLAVQLRAVLRPVSVPSSSATLSASAVSTYTRPAVQHPPSATRVDTKDSLKVPFCVTSSNSAPKSKGMSDLGPPKIIPSRFQAATAKAGSGPAIAAIFPGPGKKLAGKTALLEWVNRHIRPLGLVVNDFSKSFADGLAFAALLHQLFPQDVPFEELGPQTQRRNFTLAFAAAQQHGVESLLDVDDLVGSTPEPNATALYVTMLFKKFKTM